MGKRKITPQIAKEWLNNNNDANYRPLHEDTARKYARDMLNGDWHDTGDPIAFDVNGQLQNGQHRLYAITVADVDVRLTVEQNRPVELRDYYDIHKKRTLGNILGARGIKNGNFVAAAKRLEIDIIGLRQGRGAIGRYASEAEVLKMIDSDPSIVWVVENVINKNVIPRKLLNATVAIATYNELHKIDPYATAEFFALFVTPENMDRDHPIMALHRKFTQGSWQARGRVLRFQQVVVIYRAWNAWRGGKNADHFKAGVTNDEGKLVVPEPTKDTVLDHPRSAEQN